MSQIAPPSRQGLGQDEIDVMEIVRALVAGKKWIFLALALGLTFAVLSLLRSESLYKASALVQLEPRSNGAIPEDMLAMLNTSGTTSETETEVEILKSRMVVGDAVTALNLQITAEPKPFPILGLIPKNLHLPDHGLGLFSAYQWGTEAIKIGELEVPDAWIGEDMTLTITGEGRYSLTTPDDAVYDGTVKTRLAPPALGLALVVDDLQGPVGRVFRVSRSSLQEAIMRVQSSYTVSVAARGTAIVKLSYIAPDPRQAEAVLNAITESYVNQNIARSSAQAENSLAFIEEQLPRAKSAVDDAQQALNAYQQAQDSVDVDYETRSLLEGATKIEGELNALSLQEEELKKRYTVNHPAYQTLQQNRNGLLDQLKEIRSQTSELPETQKEIFNLTRNLEVTQQVYLQLLNRMQELRVVRASTVGSVRVIDTAYSSGDKVSPKTKMVLMMAMMLSLLGGAGGVLVARALKKGIQGAQDIEALGLPVFATVPFSKDAINHRETKGFLPILALSKPDDLVIESLRSLRTSLHFGMLDASANTLAITSTAPGAGKSFTSVNFAAVVAQAGKSVCVIDADMRRGYLRRYFRCEKGRVGLAEYLAGENSLDEVLVEGPIAGLSAITSGRFPPNPSELLMRAEFPALLEELNRRFDLVVLDCPPVLAVTDPVVVSRYCGASLLVIRHMETMRGEIEAVQSAYDTAGVKIAGAVLNGYKRDDAGNYAYYNYRYAYKSE